MLLRTNTLLATKSRSCEADGSQNFENIFKFSSHQLGIRGLKRNRALSS